MCRVQLCACVCVFMHAHVCTVVCKWVCAQAHVVCVCVSEREYMRVCVRAFLCVFLCSKLFGCIYCVWIQWPHLVTTCGRRVCTLLCIMRMTYYTCSLDKISGWVGGCGWFVGRKVECSRIEEVFCMWWMHFGRFKAGLCREVVSLQRSFVCAPSIILVANLTCFMYLVTGVTITFSFVLVMFQITRKALQLSIVRFSFKTEVRSVCMPCNVHNNFEQTSFGLCVYHCHIHELKPQHADQLEHYLTLYSWHRNV